MHFLELDTPSLLVDLPRLRGNVGRMAACATAAGLSLRPHVKTHKTPEIAALQVAAGAAGITVAKLGEAEVMAEAGFNDVFLAHQLVGPQKIGRLVALARRAKLSVGVDSVEVARPLAAAFAAEGQRLPVLLEVDVGLHRAGVLPEAVPALAARLCDLPGLELAGVFCYAGQVYAATNEAEVAQVAAQEARVMSELAAQLRPLTGTDLRVSGGSSPTARHYAPGSGLTEIRPGTYIFNDRLQVARWAARPEDCALTVLATVVSTPGPGRAVLDAGSKALAADPMPDGAGHGVLLEDLGAVVARVNEEHGMLDLTGASIKLRVGDKVRVIPNHCCVVANLFDEMVVAEADEVVARWSIRARGRMQ